MTNSSTKALLVISALIGGFYMMKKASAIVPEPPEPEPGMCIINISIIDADDNTPVSSEIFINGLSYGISPMSTTIDPADYTSDFVISFGDVEGYITHEPISPFSGGPREGTFDFVLKVEKYSVPSEVRVTTTPVTGDVYFQDIHFGPAPQTIGVSNPGTWKISFGDVVGYDTPDPIYVNVTKSTGGVYPVEGIYVIL